MIALIISTCIYALLLIQINLPGSVQDSFFFPFIIWEFLLIISFIPACFYGFWRRDFFNTGLALFTLMPLLCVLITLCFHGCD